ncbi:LysR family transcriptional regulator [Paracoccus sp. MC1862]|uniref:LysR family transcriptional regulator n=2 Tax=Paracoccus sp. MC1862 TaxID=2760307 RepID=UPI0019091653|nr:LysR family transcriptional regulator [Paracoccus sp. MC1862]QQO44988.1 LysR family transcriptional regulator [Paracoccus sp. MC1862]
MSRSMMPDLTALQAFEAAARYGSFTRAAVELNLTQSAVSRQIKDLEAQLGVALFQRVRQRVVLSSLGERLRPEIERLLSDVERLTLRAASARDVSGHLTIATLPTFGSRWLMPRLPDFLSAHPGMQATIISRSGSFDLAEAGVDVAIHYGKPVWPGATCSFLCTETVLAVVAPGLLADGATLPGTIPLLHLDSRPMLWPQWLAANGGDMADGFRGHRFDQFSLLIEAATAGMGAALLPSYLIEREIAQGDLKVIAGEPLDTDQGYWIVVAEERSSDFLLQGFTAWITRQVGQGEPAASG